MTSIADKTVKIQTTSASNITTPAWFGEVVVISSYLRKHRFSPRSTSRCALRGSVLAAMRSSIFWRCSSAMRSVENVPWRSSTSDFNRLPFPFMALFERDRLPSRSALSRFLAALTEAPVEALRTLFLDDLLARPLTPDKQTGGLVDRAGNTWMVFDIDGTREAARQRALTPDRRPASRVSSIGRRVCAWLPGPQTREKLSGRGQRCRRRIAISGSAVSETEGTGAIGKNCARDSRPLAGIWRRISFTLRAR